MCIHARRIDRSARRNHAPRAAAAVADPRCAGALASSWVRVPLSSAHAKRSKARSSPLNSRCAAQRRVRCKRERRRKADAQARHMGSARAAVRVRLCNNACELLRQRTMVESGMRQPMTGRLGRIPTCHVIAACCRFCCMLYAASYLPCGVHALAAVPHHRRQVSAANGAMHARAVARRRRRVAISDGYVIIARDRDTWHI